MEKKKPRFGKIRNAIRRSKERNVVKNGFYPESWMEKYGYIMEKKKPRFGKRKFDNDWLSVFTREKKNGTPDKKSIRNAIRRLKERDVVKICFYPKTWGLFFVTKEGKTTCEHRHLLLTFNDDEPIACLIKEWHNKLIQRWDELFGAHRECVNDDGVVYLVWDVK